MISTPNRSTITLRDADRTRTGVRGLSGSYLYDRQSARLRTSEGGASFAHAGWKPISAERMVDDLLGALLRGERVDA